MENKNVLRSVVRIAPLSRKDRLINRVVSIKPYGVCRNVQPFVVRSVQPVERAAEIRRFGVTECTRPGGAGSGSTPQPPTKKESLLKIQCMKKQRSLRLETGVPPERVWKRKMDAGNVTAAPILPLLPQVKVLWLDFYTDVVQWQNIGCPPRPWVRSPPSVRNSITEVHDDSLRRIISGT